MAKKHLHIYNRAHARDTTETTKLQIVTKRIKVKLVKVGKTKLRIAKRESSVLF